MNDSPMTLVQHLEELRRRLLWVILALVAASAAAWFYAPLVLDYLIRPVGRVVYLDVTEGFFIQLKLSVYMGATVSFPVTMYHLLAFALPALRPGERRPVLLFLPAFLALFVLGLAFAWFLFLPFAVRFFLAFAQNGPAELILSADRYVSFVLGFVIPFGFIFELPVITGALARLGLVSPQFLLRYRKHAILVIAIIAAFLTPPDVVSQVAMGLPMIALYELGIWVARLAWRRRGSVVTS